MMTTTKKTTQKKTLSLFNFLETFHCFLLDSIILGSHNIPFSDSPRNLAVILDSNLSTKKHVIKVCQTAYFELKRISSVSRFLTKDTGKTLVTFCILSWLDYCKCLLMGTPNSVIQPPPENSKLCCKSHSLGTPPPGLNTSPGKTALASHFRTY